MIQKQVIRFDPNNVEHRKDFLLLLEKKCFGILKNRYSLEGQYGDLYSMMCDKTLKFYVNKEFKLEVK